MSSSKREERRPTARSTLDWRQMSGSDIPLVVNQIWFDKQPWEDPEAYLRRSSISLVTKVKAPVLIIHNAEDYRVPIGQAYDYYQSLKMLRKHSRPCSTPQNIMLIGCCSAEAVSRTFESSVLTLLARSTRNRPVK